MELIVGVGLAFQIYTAGSHTHTHFCHMTEQAAFEDCVIAYLSVCVLAVMDVMLVSKQKIVILRGRPSV
jgi:hypothetical protein